MDRLVVAGAPGLIHRGRVTRRAGAPLHNRSFLQDVRGWTDYHLEEEGSTEGTADFSGNHERQEASRETEIKELRTKIGELVIERDFLSKAFGR